MSQPIQWSSEFFDCETSTNYYNYRYYHPEEARWLSRDSVVENSNDYVYINNKMQNFDIMGAEEYEGISDTISIPKLDEYFGLENGIDLFRVTIIESDSKLTQKIKKEFNKGISKLNFTSLAKELCKSASGEIESFLMDGLKESQFFPYDIKEKYGPDIQTFSQFPYYLAGIKEVKKGQPVRDNISVGIAGSITFPLCDVMGRTAGAKVNANLNFINNESKAYAYKFKHKQKPGIVDEKPTLEIGPFFSIENYQLLGGAVSTSVEVKGKKENWGKIDIVGRVSISYKLSF